MAQDSSHFLNELPIWKLKIVAQAFRIDVSECRYKRDYVEKVKSKRLTEEQVRNALAKGRPQNTEQAPADIRAIGPEVELIAEKPAEVSELPKAEAESVDKNLDQSLAIRPSFFEVDSTSESAYNRMILGDYYGAIKLNREARLRCLETFSNAQVYSTAVSIRAADELLARLAQDGQRMDPSLKTALAAAKRAFIAGSPRQREEALEELETLVEKAYETFIVDADKDEAELKALLSDYESFGTRTEEARRYLEIAAQARTAFNITEYARLLDQAKDKAVDAKVQRAKEIDEGFLLVRAAADEASEVGADTSIAEHDLGEARKAFDDGAFAKASMLLASVERAVDEAHLAKIRTQRDLEAKQLEKANNVLSSFEPMLVEASTYGMDVKEGLLYASNAKTALANKDVVAAAKYSHRLGEIARPLEREIDQKRIEKGVIAKAEGVKCAKCAQESVYTYQDGMKKCINCGHTIEAPPKPAPKVVQAPVPSTQRPVPPSDEQKPKKRGFFRW